MCINHWPIFTEGGSIQALADTSHQTIVLSTCTELYKRAFTAQWVWWLAAGWRSSFRCSILGGIR